MRDRTIGKRKLAWFTAVLSVLMMLGFCPELAIAAEPDKGDALGKFQVIPGSDDKAYLVDTTTGAVWVLTYRTIATGREPIAIPFKFIRSTPKNQGDFLFESVGPNAAMTQGGQ
jgi:hypothetical protein